jgi:TatD DNase family protein
MLIDAHVHLDRYGELLDTALDEIERDRILTVATAMDAPSYSELKRIAERSALILPTFGVHPRRAARYAEELRQLAPLIEDSAAIGEIGLDFHWEKNSATYPAQLKVLHYFLAAAREQEKFVNLHTKGGEKEIVDLLERYDIRRPIIHWYSGPRDILRAMIQYGCYFTVGVEVNFSDHIKMIAAEIPEHLLLTETDNPGGLKWLGGGSGMPREIYKVIETLATVRSSSPESIRRAVCTNFIRLLDGDARLANVRRFLLHEM